MSSHEQSFRKDHERRGIAALDEYRPEDKDGVTCVLVRLYGDGACDTVEVLGDEPAPDAVRDAAAEALHYYRAGAPQFMDKMVALEKALATLREQQPDAVAAGGVVQALGRASPRELCDLGSRERKAPAEPFGCHHRAGRAGRERRGWRVRPDFAGPYTVHGGRRWGVLLGGTEYVFDKRGEAFNFIEDVRLRAVDLMAAEKITSENAVMPNRIPREHIR